jgi:carboxymethylenebutenolidase
MLLYYQAAFDPRVLSAVCFFATDIHGATLGKGGDDSLARVRAGELAGKGELVVRANIAVLMCATGLTSLGFR